MWIALCDAAIGPWHRTFERSPVERDGFLMSKMRFSFWERVLAMGVLSVKQGGKRRKTHKHFEMSVALFRYVSCLRNNCKCSLKFEQRLDCVGRRAVCFFNFYLRQWKERKDGRGELDDKKPDRNWIGENYKLESQRSRILKIRIPTN